MNLYEYSMVNNFEIGILIKRNEDNENYRSLVQDCNLMTGRKELQLLLMIADVQNDPNHKAAIAKSKRASSKYCHLIASKYFSGP